LDYRVRQFQLDVMGIFGHALYDRNGNFEWGEDTLYR
jgi:hypothetical protein